MSDYSRKYLRQKTLPELYTMRTKHLQRKPSTYAGYWRYNWGNLNVETNLMKTWRESLHDLATVISEKGGR